MTALPSRAPARTSRSRFRRILRVALALCTATCTMAVQDRSASANPASEIRYELLKQHDIDEFSRTFDRDHNGRINGPEADSRARISNALNPTTPYRLAVDFCAQTGATSYQWALTRPGESDPAATAQSADCATTIDLPDKPFPDALEYGLAVTAETPGGPVSTSVDIRLQDVFIVGLGDSYGSGEGNPVNLNAEWDSRRCHRSRVSGQEQAADRLDSLPGVTVTFLHLACSGAEARVGILGSYAGLVPASPALPPQIVQAAEYVEYSSRDDGSRRWPDLIVTSVGGNDAGFAPIVKNCLQPPGLPKPSSSFPFISIAPLGGCDSGSGNNILEPGLQRLPALYDEIDLALRGQHPNLPALCNPVVPCDFLITEYPDGATDDDGEACKFHAPGFLEDEFLWVRDSMVPRLNTAIEQSANRLGWTYVSGIRQAFHGHGICAEKDWLRDILESIEIQGTEGFWDLPPDINGAFHPDGDGHTFGYTPSILDAMRAALGFTQGEVAPPPPLDFDSLTPEPAGCDQTIQDGDREQVMTVATNLAGLGIEPGFAAQIASGQLGNPEASSQSCAAWATARPTPGQAPRALVAGEAMCPEDVVRSCTTSGGFAMVRYPVFGDAAPTFTVRAAADVTRGAGSEAEPFQRRSTTATARGTAAMYAYGKPGVATVTGNIVVSLGSGVQGNGASATGVADYDLRVENVLNQQTCDGDFCQPTTTVELGRVDLSLTRSSCRENDAMPHGCATTYGWQHAWENSTIYQAQAGSTVLADVETASVDQIGAIESEGPGAGLPAPERVVRIPYSVPANSVITLNSAITVGATALEVCTFDENDFFCGANGRGGARITFEPNLDQGGIYSLTGFTNSTADTTPPTVTCTQPTDWSRTEWTVRCRSTDSGSGLADATQASFSLRSALGVGKEGPTPIDPPAVCDRSANCTDLAPFMVNVDRKAPTVTSTNAGKTYRVGESVIADATCTDGGSGVTPAKCVGGGVALATATPGTKTFQVTATDNVGNRTTKTITYAVSSVAVSIGDASIVEGNTSSRSIRVPLTLSEPSAVRVVVKLTLAEGTATAGTDFRMPNGAITVAFNPGETAKVVLVSVLGDRDVEPDETVQVNIGSVTLGAAVARWSGIATITNDD